MADPLLDRYAAALAFAREAAAGTLRTFASGTFDQSTKADGSPVTEADQAAEALLRARIQAAFPDDAILGEELGDVPGRSGWRWIIDPIDGTQSFAHGVPLFGTIVGIEHHGECVAGVIDLPALDERVAAARGHGAQAWRRGGADPVTARVRASRPLREATLCTTGPEYFRRSGHQRLCPALAESCAVLRGWSDCYAALLLATGRIDALIEPLLRPWDIAGLLPIITEAGGVVTDFAGNTSHHSTTAIAATPQTHAELLALVRRVQVPAGPPAH